MTIAILATGDEIVHGDTLNTNAHEIAKTLSSSGFSIGTHVTCSDKESDMVAAFEFLSQSHKVIIVIGGLGPTTDDRTRFALARFLQVELVEHDLALERIQYFLKKAEIKMDEGSRQQSLFPRDAKLFTNNRGTAMGACINHNQMQFYLLPGPPNECLPIFYKEVVPLLTANGKSPKKIVSWRLFAAAESIVGPKLETALSGVDCKTGYRLATPYLDFKVMCLEKYLSEVRARVMPVLEQYIILEPNETASGKLTKFLEEKSADLPSIAILDTATGGVLQTLLQQPETQSFLSFGTDSADLVFSISGLDDYWQGNETSKTSILLEYSGKKTGKKEHDLAFRSTVWMRQIAAEWICFQIFKLLNSDNMDKL